MDGFMRQSNFGIDYFISIAQWFIREGYDDEIIIKNNPEKSLQQFFMDCLFSFDCPIHRKRKAFTEKLNLDVSEWRKNFNLQGMSIGGLSFYKSNKWFGFYHFDHEFIEDKTLKFSPNEYWKDAIYILDRCFIIKKDYFVYKITYGTKDDFENKSHSSWDLSIESEIGENFMDFYNRIERNYDKIMDGNKGVLIKKYEWSNQYFKLAKL